MMFFSSVCKVLKSRMEPVIPSLVEATLEIVNTPVVPFEEKEKIRRIGANEDEEYDSEEPDSCMMGLEFEEVDERAAALSLLG